MRFLKQWFRATTFVVHKACLNNLRSPKRLVLLQRLALLTNEHCMLLSPLPELSCEASSFECPLFGDFRFWWILMNKAFCVAGKKSGAFTSTKNIPVNVATDGCESHQAEHTGHSAEESHLSQHHGHPFL